MHEVVFLSRERRSHHPARRGPRHRGRRGDRPVCPVRQCSELDCTARGQRIGDAAAPSELQPPQPIGGQVYVRQAPVPPTPPAVQVPQAREPSPEERRLIAAYQREQQAIAAPTTPRQGFGVGTPTNGPTTNNAVANVSDDAAQIAAALHALTHKGGASQISPDTVRALVSQRPQNGDGSGDYEDQNMQNHKEAFLSKSRTSPADDYLKSTRTPPRCRENLDFNGRRDGAPTPGPCEKAYVRCSEPPR